VSTVIKALTIQSRGRKYWTVLSGKYTAKLIINDATDELEIGQTVVIEVIDRTTRSRFGVDVIYEPVEVRHDLSQQDLAAELRDLETMAHG